jgi:signal peptidase I
VTLSIQPSETRSANPALLLLILWCVAVLAFLLIGTGAIWLRSWGPARPLIYPVVSSPMMPTINTGDIVLGAMYTVQEPKPRRGDIVLHSASWRGSRWFVISRVVGLPGDKVQLVGGRLHINQKLVLREPVEDYAAADIYNRMVPRYRETFPDGADHFIVETEKDRSPWDNTPVIHVPEGKVFVLGDNRDNSMDSRFTEVGAVPISNIRGFPILILWSEDRSRIGSAPR